METSHQTPTRRRVLVLCCLAASLLLVALFASGSSSLAGADVSHLSGTATPAGPSLLPSERNSVDDSPVFSTGLGHGGKDRDRPARTLLPRWAILLTMILMVVTMVGGLFLAFSYLIELTREGSVLERQRLITFAMAQEREEAAV
ncbi:hypothetical protein HDU93_002933 [Gonapodya sp. JEL0774]|nr:hypothetical protein HDU93_002933 [Gonapodya sp. JEL0774]